MGKVEKWVVLGVLALIVGILVVSLTVDDPLRRDKVVMAGETPRDAARPADPAAPAGKPSALMNSSVADPAPAAPVTPTPAPVAELDPLAPNVIPPGSILKTADGLERSYMSDTRFYTWKSGDTFAGLAQRYYGDLARLGTLRRVNEGVTDVQPGDRVLIPVFDPDVPQGVPAAPAAPVSAVAGGTTEKAAAPAAAAPKLAAADAAGPKTHVVKDGESLWIISKKELGSGVRWKEIYDANRDVLSSPEALHTGIKLRLP